MKKPISTKTKMLLSLIPIVGLVIVIIMIFKRIQRLKGYPIAFISFFLYAIPTIMIFWLGSGVYFLLPKTLPVNAILAAVIMYVLFVGVAFLAILMEKIFFSNVSAENNASVNPEPVLTEPQTESADVEAAEPEPQATDATVEVSEPEPQTDTPIDEPKPELTE